MNKKFLRKIYPNILTVAAGAASVLAFSPFDRWWLLPFSYAALFFILYLSTPGRAFIRGMLFGTAHFGLALHWLFKVAKQYPDDFSHRLVIALIISGIVCCLCLLTTFAGLLASLIPKDRRNSPAWWLILLPALFTLSEWTRGWILTGFPWFQAGHAAPLFIYSGLLPLGGILGVGLCVYLAASSLAWLLVNWRNTRVAIVAPALIITPAFVSLALDNIQWTRPLNDNSFNIQLIQGDSDLDQKSSRLAVIDRIRRYQTLASLEPRPLLSVWPESAVSIKYDRVKDELEQGFKYLTANGVEVFFGAYRGQDKKIVNAIVQASTQKIVYTKQHLLPFGEYLPARLRFIGKWLPQFRMSELGSFDQPSANIKFQNIKIAPSICFEILFGEELRQATAGADLHIHLSDLGWFKDTWAIEYFLRTARIRALESGKPMIYSVNMGNSAFIDHRGNILKRSSVKTGALIYQTIVPRRGMTPHGRYGCSPLIVSCFLSTLAAFCGLKGFLTAFHASAGNFFQTYLARN